MYMTSSELKRCADLAKEKGSSSWFAVRPLEEHGFYLHKGDALSLRYGWKLSNTPQTCNCGARFTVDHAMMGGFPTIRHNGIRDITASQLTEVCHNVATETPLLVRFSVHVQPILTTILASTSRFLECCTGCILRCTGFLSQRIQQSFHIDLICLHEQAKKCEYGQRVRDVELFAPLVFSTNGGMGKEATTYKRLDRNNTQWYG